MSDSLAPIKTCEYCGKIGKMPTFMNGETTCLDCLNNAPKTLREANHIILEFKKKLMGN